MSFFVICGNCGKQVLVDGPEDTCYWCDEPALKEPGLRANPSLPGKTKQEAKMVSDPMMQKDAPPRTKLKRAKYFEAHKGEIIADYQAMTRREFLLHWHLTTKTWGKLKELWAVTPKGRGKWASPGKTDTRRDELITGPGSEPSNMRELELVFQGYRWGVKDALAGRS